MFFIEKLKRLNTPKKNKKKSEQPCGKPPWSENPQPLVIDNSYEMIVVMIVYPCVKQNDR